MAVKTERKPQVDRSATMSILPAPIEQIAIHRLRTNGGTQMRAGLNVETVAEYTEALRAASVYAVTRPERWPFPPVIAYYDGTSFWLADGFHRVEAAHTLMRSENRPDGLYMIPTIVHAGDRRQAILHAAGANSDHGLRRTNADKRRSVETLLRDDEWSAWSDNEIAKRCHVSHTFVGQMRVSLATVASETPAERTYTTRHGTEAKMKTTKIGKTSKPPEPPQPTMPADLAALGWRLRQTGRHWYAYQRSNETNRATELADTPLAAIAAAYEMQRNIRPLPRPAPSGPPPVQANDELITIRLPRLLCEKLRAIVLTSDLRYAATPEELQTIKQALREALA